MISREKFAKFEEFLLYLYGILLFINKDIIRFCAGAVIVVLILRKILFKEKLECGNENLKKFLLFFVIGGTIWNFFGGMSYKPARNFLKMARYMPIIFYVYPMVKKDKKIVYKFLISCLIGYFALLIKVFQQYKTGIYRVSGFEDVNTTGLLGAIVASVSMGFAIGEEKLYKKLIFIIFSITGIFITIATKGRGPFVSIVGTTVILLGVYIFSKIEIKRIAKFLLIFIIAIPLFYKSIPQKNLERFKNIFDTEQTVGNSSNGLRVEMWKNAIWRIKQNPIFGSGTKYDGENLFKKYVEQMPEKTKEEKWYKEAFEHGFDDAHNMYLNATVDNGLFIIALVVVWFGIPGYLVFKYFRKNEGKILPISLLAGIISFEIQGLFWPIWRKTQQATFWILLALIISVLLGNKNDEKKSKSLQNKYLKKSIILIISLVLSIIPAWCFKDNFLEKENINITYELKSLNNLNLQSFYTKEIKKNFNEKDSIRKTFEGNSEFKKVEFEIPKVGEIYKLRIDLGEYPKEIFIKNIQIQGKNTIKISEKEVLKLKNNQIEKIELMKDNSVKIISNKVDPFIVVNSKLLKNIKNYKINLYKIMILYCIVFMVIYSLMLISYKEESER